MRIVFYSNCQARGIIYFLEHLFSEVLFDVILNYQTIKSKIDIDKCLLKSADIFIYQPIDKKHGIYSTDISVPNNILSYLSEECIKIAFPYIYNSSLWCLSPNNQENNKILEGESDNADFINAECITKLKTQGISKIGVISMFYNNTIDFEYARRYEECMNILREKERKCDIIVSDFIDKNIRKIKLFLTHNHPTACVMAHCVNQMIKILACHYKWISPKLFDTSINCVDMSGVYGDKAYYYHSHTDQKYWNFEFTSSTDFNDQMFIKTITSIYENS